VVWFVAGSVGGRLGAVLLPIAGFTLPHLEPLRRILEGTILGTALAGFTLSVAHLWWRARRR
jgi:hypothetical protein